jgi:phage shock protein PspC (stress-responsive transcriptional regulator)
LGTEEVAIDAVVGAGAAGPVPPPPVVAARPRLHRRREGQLLGGVAAGIAAHLGLPVLPVRVGMVVLLGFNGLGALLYAVFWAVLPADPDRQGARGRPVTILPFAALAVGVLIFRALIGESQPATAGFGWLVALIAIGAGIIWHQTGGLGRRRGEPAAAPAGVPPPGTPWLSAMLTEGGRRAYLMRFVGGGGLIVFGTIGLAAVYAPVGVGGVAAVLNGMLFAMLALTGLGLVTAPVLWRMFGAFREEREARIREQERAEFAAMVHDQVLHTLALIQRSAAAGSTVYRLARAQERTLRSWLYKPTGSPAEKLAAALEEAAGEVEDAYAIAVEVVAVGDADTSPGVQALVAAAREALVNAARHAQVTTVSLYAEVEPEQVSVFVRDRGVGFDPAEVEPSRHGVRGSIIGRMERHGGRAEIISTPGEGTEVRLTMPLTADGREDRHE